VDDVLVANHRSATRDRTEGELGLRWRTDLPHDKHVERRSKGVRDFRGHGHAASRQAEHDHIGDAGEIVELSGKCSSGGLTIRKDAFSMDLTQFQRIMRETYGERDRTRGTAAAVAWLAEEVGELAQAVRKGTRAQQEVELADVLAWLTSIADQLGISLDDASARYANGCPRCGTMPCTCPL
jgi:NTP pyrophosphatase (non-canonical NTP hydrolase)